jgi:hypothetical protein
MRDITIRDIHQLGQLGGLGHRTAFQLDGLTDPLDAFEMGLEFRLKLFGRLLLR